MVLCGVLTRRTEGRNWVCSAGNRLSGEMTGGTGDLQGGLQAFCLKVSIRGWATVPRQRREAAERMVSDANHRDRPGFAA